MTAISSPTSKSSSKLSSSLSSLSLSSWKKQQQWFLVVITIANTIITIFALQHVLLLLPMMMMSPEEANSNPIFIPILLNQRQEEKEEGRRRRNVLNYFLEPHQFVTTVTDCFMEPTCHIHYLHISKTGGTTIEEQFETLLNSNNNNSDHPQNHTTQKDYKFQSCCHDSAIQRFIPSKDCYKPVTSMQINGTMFYNRFIQPCFQEYNNNNNNINSMKEKTNQTEGEKTMAKLEEAEDQDLPHRMVVLISFREPISRLLSAIHPKRNKNLNSRPKEVIQICKTCNYDIDREFWHERATRRNMDYESLYHDVIVPLSSLPSLSSNEKDGNNDTSNKRQSFPINTNNNTPVLTIDTNDITPFFRMFKNQIQLPTRTTNKEKEESNNINNNEKVKSKDDVSHNSEKKDLCDFNLRSTLIKALRPSIAIYRNLTLGW